MDPIAHTFTGAALAASGLRRVTPLAAAALIIGANAPDVDVVANFFGDYAALAWRRGWTHGVLALVVLPFVVTFALLLFDRRRRRRQPQLAPARAGPLLALAALGVATHPTLDWLNNYGLRWLMPFDGRWFYGDALFIVDPWVWLILGGTLFLAYSRQPASLAAWALFAALASLLVLTTPMPAASRALWAAGLCACAAARALGFAAPLHARSVERSTAVAVGLIGVYMAAAALANVPARAEVRAALAAAGIDGVGRVMIAPAPANPFAGRVVAETPEAYHVGEWNWLAAPHFRPEPEPIPRRPHDDPVVAAAAKTTEARRYLTWSRFPYFEVESSPAGHVVRILDARYEGMGRLGGLTLRLGPDLAPQED